MNSPAALTACPRNTYGSSGIFPTSRTPSCRSIHSVNSLSLGISFCYSPENQENMASSSIPDETRRLRFGPFSLDPRAGELFKGGKKVPVQLLPLQLLGALLEKPGELVSREELKSRLWPAETFVDFEHGLNTAIKKLRKALGDNPAKP